MSLYRLLEKPAVYRTAQFVLAPGMERIVTELLSRTFARIPTPVTVLDVGCGPSSWLWKLGMKPVGLDVYHGYTKKFRDNGSLAVTASAALLPFAANSVDLVFSYGLLHHLPEAMARITVEEMIRVTRSGGHIVVFDPMLPKAAWRRPQAWALCKLDRGAYIREQKIYESRILRSPGWETLRFAHSYLGTEGALSVLRKTTSEFTSDQG
uniref:Methyltransferase type 11 n=1 Tax=Solibacter usitatus (strain Ellin6076) TaxID=234267 RepID=Q02BA5_SOLUE